MFQWNTGCYFFWCCNNYHYISDSHCINITTYIFISVIKVLYVKGKKLKKKKKKIGYNNKLLKLTYYITLFWKKKLKVQSSLTITSSIP